MTRSRAAVLPVAIAALLGAAPAGAQPTAGRSSPLPPPLRFDRIMAEHGLPAIYVTALAQDSFGFMWFGTQENGLARFDGSEMRPAKTDASDPKSLPTRWITDVAAQEGGVLWIGTDAGLLRYDGNTDTFTRFRGAPQDPTALSFDVVTALEVDRKGNVWAAAGDGRLNLYQAATGRFRRFDLAADDAYQINDLLTGADGTLWVATDGGGVFRLDPAQGRVLERLNEDSNSDLPGDVVMALLEDRAGVLWIGTDGGLVARDKGGALRRVGAGESGLTDQNITALFEDAGGQLWIGTRNGLNQLGPARDRIIRYKVDPALPAATGAYPEQVTRIMQDREGVVWVGTQTGLRKFDPIRLQFAQHVLESGTGEAQSFAEESEGVLWVGTQRGGLLRVDRRARMVSALTSLGQPNTPTHARLTGGVSALRLDLGALWIAADGPGLVRMDPETGAHETFPAETNGLNRPIGRVQAIAGDGRQLWLGTQQGELLRLDPTTRRLAAVPIGVRNDEGGARDGVHAIAVDRGKAGLLWLGVANQGLVRFEAAQGKPTRVKLPTATGKPAVTVFAVHQDARGILWLGTDSLGLARFDPTIGVTTLFGEKDGIPAGEIYGVLPGRGEQLWLSTRSAGLIAFDPGRRVAARYGRPDGTSERFQPGAHHLGRSGTIYLGGADGFNAFRADNPPQRRFQPPIVLTGFTVFNQQPALGRPIWTNPVLNLHHRDSTISFEFAALSFRAPEAIRYQYKLEGVDDDWVDTAHRSVNYTNLPGGEYVFHVRAADHHGTWSKHSLAIAVDLDVAPWRSWWAFSFYGLVALAGVISVRLHQRRRLENVRRTLKLEAAERALELTGAVQEGFLPPSNRFDGYRVRLHGFCRPAESAAGDWWWYERIDESDSLIILAGDVTGHGPGPAMVTSAAATAFSVGHKYDPELRDRFADLNEMVLSIGRGQYLMTMSGVVLDGNTGRYVLHSAGGHPLMRVSPSGEIEVTPCRGTPLGSREFSPGLKSGRVNPGDRLVIYTDGILELPVERGRILGMRSFAHMWRDTAGHEVSEAIRMVVDKADQIRGGAPQMDDWTLVVAEWIG